MRSLALVVVAMALAPVASWAQTPEDSWENVKQLPPGHKIKVVQMDLKAWSGRLVSVSDEAITIREKWKQQEITVERTKLFRVTDLTRSKRGRNALIGLCVGGIVGGAMGSQSEDLAPIGGLLIGAWFGGMGAAAGALIPYPRPTVYKAERSP